MRKLILPFAIAFLCSGWLYSQSYKLVWDEEFDEGTVPDASHWTYETGGSGWGNNELQYYTARSENAYLLNGKLIIEAKAEDYQGNEYTSARIKTVLKGDWKYGKFEIRAKLPGGTGLWPAIWMMPTESKYGTWPASGEIDIMEYVGFDPGIIHGTIHTAAYNHTLGTQKGGSTLVVDAESEFHNYSVEWTPEKIDFFVDDQKYFTFTKTSDDYKVWPFNEKFYLILNVAVGGSWGGQQGVDNNAFPAKLEVDYVRVYQDLNNMQISGPEKVAGKEKDLLYQADYYHDVSYHWKFPEGVTLTGENDLSSIKATWNCDPGQVELQMISEDDTINLIKDVTVKPISISGPMFVDPLENIAFSVPLTENADYEWNIPEDASFQGNTDSSAISITWGNKPGAVELIHTNVCGTSDASLYVWLTGQYAYPDPNIPHKIPGTIQAVEYDYGGEGRAYHDLSAGNEGTGPRSDENVDTEGSSDISNIGWIENGEWIEYTVKVTQAGNYSVSMDLASDNSNGGGPFSIRINGKTIIDNIDPVYTGGWSSFKSFEAGVVQLEESDTLLRLQFSTGGFNLRNITFTKSTGDYLKISRSKPVISPNPVHDHINIDFPDAPQSITVFSIDGIIVRKYYPETNRNRIDIGDLSPGLYLMHVYYNSGSEIIKFVKQ